MVSRSARLLTLVGSRGLCADTEAETEKEAQALCGELWDTAGQWESGLNSASKGNSNLSGRETV